MKSDKSMIAYSVNQLGRSIARITPAVIVLGLLIVTAIITLPYARIWYNVQNIESGIREPPSWSPRIDAGSYSRDGSSSSVVERIAFHAVSWMGHDDLGRSVFYRVMPATLLSLSVGLAAAVMAMIVGTLWGCLAAICGGRVDAVMMRIVDVLYGLPYILMVILLKVGLSRPLTFVFGGRETIANIAVLFLAIGGVSWLTTARVVRGEVLTLRARPFVEAARSMGAGPLHVLFRHLLPNLAGPVITCASLVVPQAILQESFLSFLGIGITPPTPSLGQLAAEGVYAVNPYVDFWWLLVFPCGVLVVVLLSLNGIGESVRRSFDPKSNESMLV